MNKIITYCDHCGKILDKNLPYHGVEIDTHIKLLTVDLCETCMEEFQMMVMTFLNMPTQND